MLQSTEYRAKPYLNWYWHTANFSRIEHRRRLERTRPAKLLLLAGTLGSLLVIVFGLALVIRGFQTSNSGLTFLGLAAVVSYPVLIAHLLALPLTLGRLVIVGPKERKLVRQSANRFSGHKAIKIAVAGSYGKTSMKEILGTVLSAGRKVAITPANMNVAVSHAKFAKQLNGDEEVLVIEYGEGKPGDVERFIKTTSPDIGVITGLAPAHLDQYKTLEAAGKDIWTLAEALKNKPVYANAESRALHSYITNKQLAYSQKGVGDWHVSGVGVEVDSLRFDLKKGAQTVHVTSRLIGRHQIGPLSAAAALALELGLTVKQVEQGLSETAPFEHRMQPRNLHGAWIIDDTYNGNIEGAEAGLVLLAELKATRKLYVTPGLVDQGAMAQAVHVQLGQAIARCNPDIVVLMQNSVTHWIQRGLDKGKYHGTVQIQDDPLSFYTNVDQFIVRGDIVLMQNDWTDNYS